MIEKKIDYQRVLTFLEHKHSKVPEHLDLLIKEGIQEVLALAQIKFCYLTTDRKFCFREPVKETILFALTLGASVDHRILYYEKTYVTKAVIADAAANAMMESAMEQLEEYLRNLYLENSFFLTEMMCPGNGGIPLEWNGQIVNMLDAQKRIGLYHTDHNSLLPQKSTVGFFGITDHPICRKKSKCENCTANCKYRKKSETWKSENI